MNENQLKIKQVLDNLVAAEQNAPNQSARNLTRDVADSVHDLYLQKAVDELKDSTLWSQNHNQSSMFDYYLTSAQLILESLLNDRRVQEELKADARAA